MNIYFCPTTNAVPGARFTNDFLAYECATPLVFADVLFRSRRFVGTVFCR